jgi:hypothetical protein
MPSLAQTRSSINVPLLNGDITGPGKNDRDDHVRDQQSLTGNSPYTCPYLLHFDANISNSFPQLPDTDRDILLAVYWTIGQLSSFEQPQVLHTQHQAPAPLQRESTHLSNLALVLGSHGVSSGASLDAMLARWADYVLGMAAGLDGRPERNNFLGASVN